jgi:hypothetical protein
MVGVTDQFSGFIKGQTSNNLQKRRSALFDADDVRDPCQIVVKTLSTARQI